MVVNSKTKNCKQCRLSLFTVYANAWEWLQPMVPSSIIQTQYAGCVHCKGVIYTSHRRPSYQ